VFTPMRDQPPTHRLEVIIICTTTEHWSLRVWGYIEPGNKMVLVDPLCDVNCRIPLYVLYIVVLSGHGQLMCPQLTTHSPLDLGRTDHTFGSVCSPPNVFPWCRTRIGYPTNPSLSRFLSFIVTGFTDTIRFTLTLSHPLILNLRKIRSACRSHRTHRDGRIRRPRRSRR
jgi:hypothetical protein